MNMIFPALVVAAAPTTAAVGSATFGLVCFIVFIALVFDFLNGFHDAANSIATVVSTRVLTPTQAVIWAAFFNFAAAFIFGTKVADTISGKLIDVALLGTMQTQVHVIFAGLLAAIAWNIITWLLALPTSSSHALISGFGGAAIACAGFHVIKPLGWALVLAGIVLSPLLGFILGAANMIAISWIFRRSTPHRVDTLFRRLQLVSAAVYSLGHGGNDAQKTMGIIVALLGSAGLGAYAAPEISSWTNHLNIFGAEHHVAWWIILVCNGAMALGTIFGGWRIVKTMGSRITRLTPVGGFSAETAAATTIIGFTAIGGVPISTTHAITGAILGVGTTRGVRSVRWIWGERIVLAWILTIPCAAFMGGAAYVAVHLIFQAFSG